MRWRRGHDKPPISQRETSRRRAEADAAAAASQRLAQEVSDRGEEVRTVREAWSELREHNHFGELITKALRGRP